MPPDAPRNIPVPDVSCSVTGCDRPRLARGLCSMHYQYAKRYDALPPRTQTASWDMLRFIANALRSNSDECCLWPHGKTGAGYGEMTLHGHRRLVHRFVCEVVHGSAPSQKHEVAHSCGVRACINPRHLRWDTRKGNHADKIIHGTAQRGDLNGSAKLTTAQVLQIRAQPHKSVSGLAAEFGVDPSNIGHIRNRKSWRHL
jgi:HNH endonuclease